MRLSLSLPLSLSLLACGPAQEAPSTGRRAEPLVSNTTAFTRITLAACPSPTCVDTTPPSAPPVPIIASSDANAINAFGQVGGAVRTTVNGSTEWHAAIWSAVAAPVAGVLPAPLTLPPIVPTPPTGQVVAVGTPGAVITVRDLTQIWNNQGDLPPATEGKVLSMNDSGNAVGWMKVLGAQQAFFYEFATNRIDYLPGQATAYRTKDCKGQPTTPPKPDAYRVSSFLVADWCDWVSQAYSINNNNVVVGKTSIRTFDSDDNTCGGSWSGAAGVSWELNPPASPRPSPVPPNTFRARILGGVNDLGKCSAWDDKTKLTIGSSIAWAINDDGDIIGHGSADLIQYEALSAALDEYKARLHYTDPMQYSFPRWSVIGAQSGAIGGLSDTTSGVPVTAGVVAYSTNAPLPALTPPARTVEGNHNVAGISRDGNIVVGAINSTGSLWRSCPGSASNNYQRDVYTPGTGGLAAVNNSGMAVGFSSGAAYLMVPPVVLSAVGAPLPLPPAVCAP